MNWIFFVPGKRLTREIDRHSKVADANGITGFLAAGS
jgi:hypothetical protein